jgi:hypothetical protein
MTKNIFQKFYKKDLNKVYKKFTGYISDNKIGDIPDIQKYFENVNSKCKAKSRILISYHNHLWEPILTLATKLNLRRKVGIQNWLDQKDIGNILNLSGFEIISTATRFFGITTITIARPKPIQKIKRKELSVSIIIPARNEEINIPKIIPSIPKFGKFQEIIFIEGWSKDKTWEKIKVEEKKRKNVIAFKQTGKGKANAVWIGFEKAKGDILMIYDADRTVESKDLPKFYNALRDGLGEFANGSRLIYPMENLAMQSLNKIGNKIFSILFTWILRQSFKDTLCGTKALFRKDYLYMKRHNKKYFKMDPFGDFALIFGAIRNNLKVIEIPVRYKEREYGVTNISRFKHGLMLLRMTWEAFKEFSV